MEIHDLAIVNTMGIDINDSGEFEITTVIVKPSSLFPKSVGGTSDSKQNKYLIETATGQTVFDAMSKLSKSVPGNMYVGHMDVVVFGEKAAREKMLPAIDFISRANEFRPNIFLLVTKGKAADIVTTSPVFCKTIGLEVKNLTNMNRFVATKMVKDISKFREALTSNTTDPVTAVLTSSNKLGIQTKGEVQENHYLQKEAPPVISLDGTAVFRKGNLKGFLNEEETRGLLWINGDLKREIIVLKSERNKNQKISVLIKNSKSQLMPEISGHGTKMIVKTFVEADIGDITCPSLHLDSNEMNRLNQQLEEIIKIEEQSVLVKAQKQWQTDIFGFGKTIYRNQPRVWDLMAPNWRNGGLKDMEVDLKVEANISRYGLLKDPSNPNESR
jgi:spore germination protein KC